MSYEQKYLKYKQKYKTLKKQYTNIYTLETANENINNENINNENINNENINIDNFDLTDTPGTLPSMRGGSRNSSKNGARNGARNGAINSAINDFILSDTPTNDDNMIGDTMNENNSHNNMTGGTAPFVPLSGPQVCPGIVNAQPSVIVPMTGGNAPFVPLSGPQVCPGIVNAQPSVMVPMAGGTASMVQTNEKDNNTFVETTTELSNISTNTKSNSNSDIRNTADIEKLFKQLGGKKKHKKSSSESSSSSSESSSSSSSSDLENAFSGLEDTISFNDI